MAYREEAYAIYGSPEYVADPAFLDRPLLQVGVTCASPLVEGEAELNAPEFIFPTRSNTDFIDDFMTKFDPCVTGHAGDEAP